MWGMFKSAREEGLWDREGALSALAVVTFVRLRWGRRMGPLKPTLLGKGFLPGRSMSIQTHSQPAAQGVPRTQDDPARSSTGPIPFLFF